MKYNNSKIIKICKQKLIFLNYAESTVKMYLYYIEEFISSLNNKQYIHLNSKDFQNYLDSYNFTSISKQNQVISAIKFLYKHGLNKKYDKVSFKRPLKEKTLPKVIDKDTLTRKINSVKNLKHRSILALAYSTGLRVSELLNLKLKDVDSKRMLINVVNGKGRKDRYVPLSENMLYLLRRYYKEHEPKEFLFEGQKGGKYSKTSCNNIVKRHLGESAHMHRLRHSCFTSLLESGTDLRVIQKIAGHSSSKTTEVYTHVSNNVLNRVSLPM